MSTPAPYGGSTGQPPYGYGYPGPGYPGQPQGYGPPTARDGLATTSMVLGILGLATCWLTFPGIILGILAIIFGGIGIARGRSDRVSNKGMAIAGLVTGIIAVILGAAVLVFLLHGMTEEFPTGRCEPLACGTPPEHPEPGQLVAA